MCGILFALNKKGAPVSQFIEEQYEDQKSRGQRGFGIAFQNEKGAIDVLRSVQDVKFFINLAIQAAKSPLILAHHRMPTSSENKISQTHPILVSHKMLASDWLVIHNGIIRNADSLKTLHEDMGFVYTTEHQKTHTVIGFNDSEALAIEVALYLERQSQEIGTEGPAAWIALEIDKKTQKPLNVHFATNRGDLKGWWNENEFYLASELATKDAEEVPDGFCFHVSLTEKKISLEKTEIAWKKVLQTGTAYHYHDSQLAKVETKSPIGFKTEIETQEDREIEKAYGGKDNSPKIKYHDVFKKVGQETKLNDATRTSAHSIFSPYFSTGDFNDLADDFVYFNTLDSNNKPHEQKTQDKLEEDTEEDRIEQNEHAFVDLEERACSTIEDYFLALRDPDGPFTVEPRDTTNTIRSILDEGRERATTKWDWNGESEGSS